MNSQNKAQNIYDMNNLLIEINLKYKKRKYSEYVYFLEYFKVTKSVGLEVCFGT